MGEVEQEVGRIFKELDLQVAKRLVGQPVTCSRGCIGCCYQLVAIGIGEAIYIGSEVARWDNWREWAERLFQAAKEMTTPGVRNANWFDRSIPCVFLTDDRSCRIYDRRPSACRYHWVKSPMENCFPDAIDPEIQIYDFRKIYDYIVRVDRAIWHENPHLGHLAVGLLPHFVLYVLGFAIEHDDRCFIRGLLSKLPTVHEWSRVRTWPNGQPERKR
jgi:hypothetical protein